MPQAAVQGVPVEAGAPERADNPSPNAEHVASPTSLVPEAASRAAYNRDPHLHDTSNCMVVGGRVQSENWDRSSNPGQQALGVSRLPLLSLLLKLQLVMWMVLTPFLSLLKQRTLGCHYYHCHPQVQMRGACQQVRVLMWMMSSKRRKISRASQKKKAF